MLILFDCDGVLLDSELLVARAAADLLREQGYETTPEALVTSYTGTSTAEMLADIEEQMERHLPHDFHQRLDDAVEVKLEKSVQAMEGAHDLLDMFDDARCVCSNSSSDYLQKHLRATGLHDRFRPYVFSAPEVGTKKPKPAPDVYLHAAKELETAPADCIVIEDSPHGVAAARAAGMRVIGFIGGSHAYPSLGELLMEAGAETVVRRLTDCASVIEAFRDWDGL